MAAEAHHRARELEQRREITRWARPIRSAVRAGVDPFDLDRLFGEGAYAFTALTSELPLGQAVTHWLRAEADVLARNHANAFTFDGSMAELAVHNREASERARADAPRRPVPQPLVAPLIAMARPRERRPSCASRPRGSRRTSRSCSRGGDSGDDPGGGDPEPELGHQAANQRPQRRRS